MDRFRAKARQFLKANQSHIAILKLYRNEPLTKTDLAELECMFAEAGVGIPKEIERLRADGGLGLFVRSLVALDRAAGKRAFDTFIEGGKLTAHQHEFVDMVIEHSRHAALWIHGCFTSHLLPILIPWRGGDVRRSRCG
jgi:type I restriction enzyme, R subunit